MKRALVVAGGQWQMPVIRYLQSNSYSVTVVDPYNSSSGVLIANEHITADARDVQGILALVGDRQFDVVTSDQSDISVETVAILAAHFGLPGNNLAAVKKFSNKFLSRQYAASLGVPIPAYYRAHTIGEVKQIVGSFQGDMILKPVDSQSSRGIFKIDKTNIQSLEEFAKLTFAESKEQYILIEEFFDGEELTVEGICSDGKHKTLAISTKKHFRTGIASDLTYPATLPDEIEKEIMRNNDLYVARSGLRFGITHAEYLYNANTGKICLVEIACRGGGSLISSDIARWVSGIDLYAILLRDLAGESTDVLALVPLKRPAILHFFEFPNGIVEDVRGLADIANMQGVVAIKMDFKKGDHIRAANDDRSRQGFVILLAENTIQLQERLALVIDTLKVTIRNVQ